MTTITTTENIVTVTVTETEAALTVTETPVSLTVASGATAASESTAGIAKFATAAEAAALTSTNKTITPATFDDALGGVDGKLIRVDINGLVGDGSTEDTAALQTILTANETTNDIILRFAPNKTYLLDTVAWSGSGSLIVDARGANFKLVDGATEEHIFDVVNPTRFHIVGGTFQGNEANQTGTAEALIEVTSGANTKSVIIQGVRFEDVKSKAIRVIGASSGAVGSRFVSISDIELDTVTGNVGDPACIIVRGNQENTVIDNIRAFDCALVDAGKVIGFSADVSTTSDKIGNITISNVVTQNCGTTIFGQSYRNATITNITSRDIGTSSGGTDYNVNFIKIDDAGADAITFISNAVGTNSNGTYTPAIRFEETDGLLDKVTQNITMNNVYCDGDIVASASGGHKLINCETQADFAVNDNCDMQLCTGGTSFNVSGTKTLLVGCVSPLLTFTATASHCTAQGGYYEGVNYANGATYCYVNGGAKIQNTGGGNSCVNMSGDYQFLEDVTIDHSGGIAIDIEKVGAVGIHIKRVDMQQVSTGSTVPLIRMNDPLEVFLIGNQATGSAGSRMRRTNQTQSIRGEISGNIGFEDGFTGLPGSTVGDLIMENNKHWAGGSLTYLPSYHPNGYTITNDTTDRTFDANSTSIAELADVVATLIKDMDKA